MSSHTGSIEESSEEVASQVTMSIAFMLLSVLRVTCGQALSCWNNMPDKLAPVSEPAAKTTWLTYHFPVKLSSMCTRAFHWPNMITLQTIIRDVRAVRRSTIWVTKGRRLGSPHTQTRPSFVNKQNLDSSAVEFTRWSSLFVPAILGSVTRW